MKRVAALVCLGIAVISGLTACDQNMSQGPVAIKRDGSELYVAVCENIEAKSVLVETWARGNGTPTTTVLDATGVADLQNGSVFPVSESVEGLTALDRNPPAIRAGDNFAIPILSNGSQGDDINATFTVGDSGLSESLWLQPDGRETAEPGR